MTIQECLESRGVYETIKGFSKDHKVAIPEIVARMVQHVLTGDDAASVVADLVSDAPRSSRGRKPLDPSVKAAREALRQASRSTDLSALQAAIDSLTGFSKA